MSNPVALGLAGLILFCVLVDGLANDGDALLFLAGKTISLIEYLAFWR